MEVMSLALTSQTQRQAISRMARTRVRRALLTVCLAPGAAAALRE